MAALTQKARRTASADTDGSAVEGLEEDRPVPAEYGHEEEAILRDLPDSPRLRRILRDLESLFLTEGFLHLSTADISSRLRCSKSTLYRFAPTSDDLYELVIRIWLARANDRMWQERETATDWRSRLIGAVSSTGFLEQGTSYQFVKDLRAFPGGQRAFNEYLVHRRKIVESIIQGGIDSGIFNEIRPDLATAFLNAAAEQILQPEFLASIGISVKDAFSQMLRIFEFGLLRRPD